MGREERAASGFGQRSVEDEERIQVRVTSSEWFAKTFRPWRSGRY